MCVCVCVCVYTHITVCILFCVLLQTMAIATLAACYNNPRVFTGPVKIRKGQAVELIMESTCIPNVHRVLAHHTHQVHIHALLSIRMEGYIIPAMCLCVWPLPTDSHEGPLGEKFVLPAHAQ